MHKTIRITDRASKLILSSIPILTLAVLYSDVFLLILLAVLAFTMVGSLLATMIRKRRKLISFDPEEVEVRLVAGSSKEITVGVESEVYGSIENIPSFMEMEKEVVKGFTTKTIKISPELAGDHEARDMIFKFYGPLGLVEGLVKTPLSIRVKAYPRVVVAIVEALRFLVGAGKRGFGEVLTQEKGKGTEYHSSRDYVEGDDLASVDWKGTARRGKLVVKEFFKEGGRGVHMVYDVRSYGPLSHDLLATSFLNASLAVAREGMSMGFTVHDGDEVILHVKEERPEEALKLALSYVLRSYNVELEEVSFLIDPATSKEVKALLERLKGSPFEQFLKAKLETMRLGIKKPENVVREVLLNIGEGSQLVYITALARGVSGVLEVNDVARMRGHVVTAVVPVRPWVEVEGIEKAYRAYEQHFKMLRAMERRGIRVVKEFNFKEIKVARIA